MIAELRKVKDPAKIAAKEEAYRVVLAEHEENMKPTRPAAAEAVHREKGKGRNSKDACHESSNAKMYSKDSCYPKVHWDL